MGVIQRICQHLGKENNALYAVVTVAIFKSISRPIFTMMDKKADTQRKKYTALRESATEIIAIPTYIAVAKASEKLAPLFHSKKVKGSHIETTKTALGFIGVCFAGSVIIPWLCNLVMPFLFKNKNNISDTKRSEFGSLNTNNTLKSTPISQTQQPQFVNIYPKTTNLTGGLKI